MIRKIEADLREAMKGAEKVRVSTLRLLLAALKNERLRAGREITEEEVEAIVRQGVKQRRYSIDLYEKGGRADLVAAEKAEIEVLETYLPQALSEDEIEEAVQRIIAEKSFSSAKDVGALMKELMTRYRGRMDGRRAQEIAHRLLA